MFATPGGFYSSQLDNQGVYVFIQAFQYKCWADKRTLDAIEAIDRITFPESYSFCLQQINHMVIVEELFQSRLLGLRPPHQSTNSEVVPSFEDLKERLVLSGDWYSGFITEVRDLGTHIKFTFADGLKGMLSIEEILFHVVNHGSYHRGNIAHALDLASVAHPIDGYGIFIHEKEPGRRGSKWNSAE